MHPIQYIHPIFVDLHRFLLIYCEIFANIVIVDDFMSKLQQKCPTKKIKTLPTARQLKVSRISRPIGTAFQYMHPITIHASYYNVSEVGGSETNREIDFGFGSCVRARALVVRWEFGQIVIAPLSLFPFLPAAFPFSLFSQRF